MRVLGRDADGLRMAERDHPAEAGPAHVVHLRERAQQLRNRAAVLRVRRHAQVQRPQAAVDEKAVERARHGADRVLHEAHALVQLRVAHHDGAADHVGVPAEVLRGRMHDGVRTELQGPLDDRRSEGVVDGDERVAGPCYDRLDVDHIQQRVGRRLHPDQPGLGSERGLERVEVCLVHHVVAQPEAREHLVEQPVGPAVQVRRQQHVVTRIAVRRDERVRCRHAAREARAEAALQLAQRALERRAGRVRGARVVEVLDELAGRRLHVGGGLMDRRDRRSR